MALSEFLKQLDELVGAATAAFDTAADDGGAGDRPHRIRGGQERPHEGDSEAHGRGRCVRTSRGRQAAQ